jgi:LacI family transcriptional regulator
LRGVTIRSDARLRVASAIERLGYIPDEAARALRGGASRTIGIVVPQVDNTFFSKAIQAMELEAHRRGFAIILLLHEEDKDRQLQQLATLKRYRADGVILAATSTGTPDEIRLVLAETPVVAFDRMLSCGFDSVTLRNAEAARAATDHLLQHGYRRIACVTAKSDLFTFKERILGYTEAMEVEGYEPMVMEAIDYDDLRLMLASALSNRRRPDALLSLSNMATRSILFAFNDMSLIGKDRLPLIGFDDFDFAPLMTPALTVIRQPVDLMVRYALDLLFRKIDGRGKTIRPEGPVSEDQVITLAGELICRHSCGCG